MKHLNRFNIINEGWQSTLKRELIAGKSYNREDDLRHYFLDLMDDIGWKELPIRNRVCDEDFWISDVRIYHLVKSLYPRYTFTFERSNPKRASMDVIIETMEDITEIVERLRSDGYIINIDMLTVGNSINERFEISIYHPEDVIDWEKIFIKKELL